MKKVILLFVSCIIGIAASYGQRLNARGEKMVAKICYYKGYAGSEKLRCTISYGYDENGNMISVQYEDKKDTRYKFMRKGDAISCEMTMDGEKATLWSYGYKLDWNGRIAESAESCEIRNGSYLRHIGRFEYEDSKLISVKYTYYFFKNGMDPVETNIKMDGITFDYPNGEFQQHSANYSREKRTANDRQGIHFKYRDTEDDTNVNLTYVMSSYFFSGLTRNDATLLTTEWLNVKSKHLPFSEVNGMYDEEEMIRRYDYVRDERGNIVEIRDKTISWVKDGEWTTCCKIEYVE